MKKTIFFKINGFSDKVMITNKTTSEEITDLIRSIGKINLKEVDCLITSPNGTHLVDPDYYSLSENSQSTPYVVEINPPKHSNNQSDNSLIHNHVNAIQPSNNEREMAKLLFEQEKKLEQCEEMLKNALNNFESRFVSLTSKIENISFIKWMQPKSIRPLTSRFGPTNYSLKPENQPPCPNPESIVPYSHLLTAVLSEYKILKLDQNKEDIITTQLKKISFNNWLYSDAELLYFVKKMFIDLELISEFNISVKKFDRWIFEVYCNYNIVPFHNFKHAFMVTQMMYSIIWEGQLKSKMSSIDMLILLTASVSHDLNHPGFNNAYQINSGSELAIRYNDQSPLENHHLSTALYILNHQDCAIFSHLTTEQQRYIRSGMIKCILATDMSRHNEILNSFKSILPNFDWLSQSHRDLLMMILIKASDISNEARPLDVASKWIDCLFEEFFNQSAFEKQSGLPVAPFMDKEKVTKAASQCGFIRFVIFPLFESLTQLIPEYKEHLLIPVLRQLDYYSQLDIITNGKPKSRKSIIENFSKNQFRRASHQCSSQNYSICSNIEAALLVKSNQPTESVRKLSS